MPQEVEAWRQSDPPTLPQKMSTWQAFIESELEVPWHLARRVQDLCPDPQSNGAKPRTVWTLSNAFPFPCFKQTFRVEP